MFPQFPGQSGTWREGGDPNGNGQAGGTKRVPGPEDQFNGIAIATLFGAHHHLGTARDPESVSHGGRGCGDVATHLHVASKELVMAECLVSSLTIGAGWRDGGQWMMGHGPREVSRHRRPRSSITRTPFGLARASRPVGCWAGIRHPGRFW